MVAHSGTPSRPADLRPLNVPKAIVVTVRDNHPATIVVGGTSQTIIRVQDTWLIEEEWWRQPIRRQYFHVLLAHGQQMTIFHDRTNGSWWDQEY